MGMGMRGFEEEGLGHASTLQRFSIPMLLHRLIHKSEHSAGDSEMLGQDGEALAANGRGK